MTAHLQIALMGGAKISLGGEDLTNDLPAKMRVLMAYLVMEEGAHSRPRLAAWLWENADAGGLRNLRVNLTKLRRHLHEFLLVTDSTIAFNPNASFDLDVENFEYAYQLAEKVNGAERRAYLRDAIALYRGEFLADLPVEGLLIYDEWVTSVRTRLRQKMLSALDMLVDVCLELGDYQTGIEYAQELLALDDWREKSHRQLMQLYAANGQRGLALRQFEICRQVLADEFGTPPTAVTLNAYERIRALDDGRPFAVVLPRLDGETAVPFEAPIAIAHFTGRDSEMDALGDRLLQSGAGNVVALVGLGGVGKTALATMLAHDLRDAFTDGVLWANAATADPMSLAGRWANLFGYDFSQISRLEDRAAALRDLLSAKRVLIVFDNVTSPAWVRQFIPQGDRAAVLLTTRNADHAYLLQARVEEVGVLTWENGRALLTEIIGERVEKEPEAALAIYQLLHGLPLAITIAAKQLARRRRRSLSWLVSRLQDETNRIDLADESGAVRASFAFSWQGLDETQKRVFSWLAVFGGRDFPVAAAAEIAGIPIFPAHDQLDMLVNLSLLNEVSDARYRQHPLLADFATEKLAGNDEPFGRMVNYFLTFASEHQSEFLKLRPEWENLSASIAQAYRLAMWPTVVKFTHVLREAWFTRGRYAEARKAFLQAYQASQTLADKQTEADCLFEWGLACVEQSDYEEAQRHLTKSLALYQSLGQKNRIADVQCELGRIALEVGDYAQARILLTKTLALRDQLGDRQGKGVVLYRLARVAYRNDEADTAVSLAQDALKIQEEVGDEGGRLPTMRLLANLALLPKNGIRDIGAAASYYQRVMAIAEKLNDENERALALRGLSIICMYQGKLREGLAFSEESEQLLRRIGDRKSVAQTQRQLSRIWTEIGDFEAAEEQANRALKVSRDLNDRLLEGYILFELGKMYTKSGNKDKAQDSFRQSLEIGEELNHERLKRISQAEMKSW